MNDNTEKALNKVGKTLVEEEGLSNSEVRRLVGRVQSAQEDELEDVVSEWSEVPEDKIQEIFDIVHSEDSSEEVDEEQKSSATLNEQVKSRVQENLQQDQEVDVDFSEEGLKKRIVLENMEYYEVNVSPDISEPRKVRCHKLSPMQRMMFTRTLQSYFDLQDRDPYNTAETVRLEMTILGMVLQEESEESAQTLLFEELSNLEYQILLSTIIVKESEAVREKNQTSGRINR